ncbi:unnamed protein product [Meganyctiphanes norvegica]|uniref:Uncharacterized protein n=1 Tax=Meganyctiphanes norvegica TaxID=48144 RepID=A0AAV2R9Y1_MEGNR
MYLHLVHHNLHENQWVPDELVRTYSVLGDGENLVDLDMILFFVVEISEAVSVLAVTVVPNLGVDPFDCHLHDVFSIVGTADVVEVVEVAASDAAFAVSVVLLDEVVVLPELLRVNFWQMIFFALLSLAQTFLTLHLVSAAWQRQLWLLLLFLSPQMVTYQTPDLNLDDLCPSVEDP